MCLEESLYIHSIRDMKVLHTIRETPPNPAGKLSRVRSSAFLIVPFKDELFPPCRSHPGRQLLKVLILNQASCRPSATSLAATEIIAFISFQFGGCSQGPTRGLQSAPGGGGWGLLRPGLETHTSDRG